MNARCFKIINIQHGNYVAYFGDMDVVYSSSELSQFCGQEYEKEEYAHRDIQDFVLRCITEFEVYPDVSDLRVEEIITYTSRTIDVNDYISEHIQPDSPDREAILSVLLQKAVHEGFKIIPESSREKIFTDAKYAKILKQHVPSLMITEWKDYIDMGILDLTSEQLSAILMLCTDDLCRAYSLEKIIDIAIQDEK